MEVSISALPVNERLTMRPTFQIILPLFRHLFPLLHDTHDSPRHLLLAVLIHIFCFCCFLAPCLPPLGSRRDKGVVLAQFAVLLL